MKRICPHCKSSEPRCSKFGSFVRPSDGRRLKRFQCHHCRRTFSEATFQRCYRQKKRYLNPRIRELLLSCVSQRRAAKLLKISRTTLVRKFLFEARWAKIDNLKDMETVTSLTSFQFDDLETFEHTKLKPLSVIAAVGASECDNRRIFGFRVARMPAKGVLAKRSREKYGPRPDQRRQKRHELFQFLAPKVAQYALIASDENPHYPPSVKKFFPEATHKTVKGQRGCVVGQGELKKIGFDPLFSLNHTFAMFRANISRLVRKTWNTTKLPERLEAHIELYVRYHNRVLIPQMA